MYNLQIISIKNLADARKELVNIGVDNRAIEIMAGKAVILPVKLYSVDCAHANILKQEMLALGGEAAVSKEIYALKNNKTDILIFGTIKQYKYLISKLNIQPFSGFKKFGQDLNVALKNYQNIPQPLVSRSKTFSFDKKCYIIGIVNVTPDSFSDGNKFLEPEMACEQALKLIEDGADIIDIGGESTRPGSDKVSVSMEKKRVLPVIKKLSGKIKIPVSIDTYKSSVAQAALDEGAEIINDISGLRFDKKMAALAARYKVPVIIMHIKGKPKDMQINPSYNNIFSEITDYLRHSIEIAEKAGVKKEKIVIDPGIGFGKNIDNNLELIKNLRQFKILGHPILLGTSRKSFIGKILGLGVEERLEGTIASSVAGFLNGANFLRVHDVRSVKKAIKMTEKILSV
ncbi:MAG: dihydropteroate synthase [bacterium]|nr:dihydropteroate synthase [bacterium]